MNLRRFCCKDCAERYVCQVRHFLFCCFLYVSRISSLDRYFGTFRDVYRYWVTYLESNCVSWNLSYSDWSYVLQKAFHSCVEMLPQWRQLWLHQAVEYDWSSRKLIFLGLKTFWWEVMLVSTETIRCTVFTVFDTSELNQEYIFELKSIFPLSEVIYTLLYDARINIGVSREHTVMRSCRLRGWRKTLFWLRALKICGIWAEIQLSMIFSIFLFMRSQIFCSVMVVWAVVRLHNDEHRVTAHNSCPSILNSLNTKTHIADLWTWQEFRSPVVQITLVLYLYELVMGEVFIQTCRSFIKRICFQADRGEG